MTNIKQSTAKAIKLEFAPGEKVTSFGGMAVVGRLLGRLGVRRLLKRSMPERGGYGFFEVISSAMTGLLTGARGTFATQVVREDAALLRLSSRGSRSSRQSSLACLVLSLRTKEHGWESLPESAPSARGFPTWVKSPSCNAASRCCCAETNLLKATLFRIPFSYSGLLPQGDWSSWRHGPDLQLTGLQGGGRDEDHAHGAGPFDDLPAK